MPQSSVQKKLFFKPGMKLAFLNAPGGFPEYLGLLPEATAVSTKPGASQDFVRLFAKDSGELEMWVPLAIESLKPDGIFWISCPKGSSRVKSDLNRDILCKLMEEKGFDGVALISIDEVWSAMRFRPSERVGKPRR